MKVGGASLEAVGATSCLKRLEVPTVQDIGKNAFEGLVEDTFKVVTGKFVNLSHQVCIC